MLKFALPAVVFFLAVPASAQHSHSGPADSMNPTETGQSAFAAIAEIVQILNDDPETDWDKVNIQALRDHLVDMDLVMTQAVVSARTEGRTVEFSVTGDEAVAGAAKRMVLAIPQCWKWHRVGV